MVVALMEIVDDVVLPPHVKSTGSLQRSVETMRSLLRVSDTPIVWDDLH